MNDYQKMVDSDVGRKRDAAIAWVSEHKKVIAELKSHVDGMALMASVSRHMIRLQDAYPDLFYDAYETMAIRLYDLTVKNWPAVYKTKNGMDFRHPEDPRRAKKGEFT